MTLRSLLCAAILAAASQGILAMSQCIDENGCIDEFSAADYLARLRASDIYRTMHAKAVAEGDKLDKPALVEACDSLLRRLSKAP